MGIPRPGAHSAPVSDPARDTPRPTLATPLARLSRWAVIVLAAVVVCAALREAAIVIMPVAVSLWLAAAVWPLHARIARLTTPWVGAAVSTAVVTLAGALVVGAVWYTVDSAAEEFRRSQGQYEQRYDQARQWLVDHGAPTRWIPPLDPREADPEGPQGRPPEEGRPDPAETVASALAPGDPRDARDRADGSWFGRLPDRAARHLAVVISGGLRSGVSLAAGAALTIFLMALLLGEFPTWRRAAEHGLDPPHRAALADGVRDWARHVRGHLWAKTITGLVSGVATGLWLWFMGVPLPVVWGVLTLLLNYIPNIGALLSGIPPTLLAAIQLGLGEAAIVAAGLVTIEVLIGNLLAPLIEGDILDLSPYAVLVSVVFWGWLWGAVGAALSVSLTSALLIACKHIRAPRAHPPDQTRPA